MWFPSISLKDVFKSTHHEEMDAAKNWSSSKTEACNSPCDGKSRKGNTFKALAINMLRIFVNKFLPIFGGRLDLARQGATTIPTQLKTWNDFQNDRL